MDTPTLGIVGWSGSGKTTLLEFVVAQLVAQRMRVNVVKHSHHDVTLEPPHKDSARMRQAGAQEVLLVSPYRIAIVRELRDAPEPDLSSLLKQLAPADLNLVEGYKWAEIAKLEVYRPSLGKAAIYPDDPYILAVASDIPRPEDCPAHIQWLNLNQRQLVLDWVLLYLQQARKK